MKYPDIISGRIEKDKITPDINELSRRLSMPRAEIAGNIQIINTTQKIAQAAEYKFAYVRTKVSVSDGICDFGFMKIKSRNLSKNLSGCNEAFLLAVTVGIGVDRLLQSLRYLSPATHFIADGISSALAEGLCEYTAKLAEETAKCRARFSPGYGDVSLACQEPLLERLDAANTLGITLNSAYLMTPLKSITAIMGIDE